MKKLSLLMLLFSTCFVKNSFSEPIELIESITIAPHNKLTIRVNQDFKQRYLLDDFFVEYAQDIDLTKLDASIVIMPFIMNIVSLVWYSGKDYVVESMDATLYESLQKVREVFRRLHKNVAWNGNLIAKRLIHNLMDQELIQNNEDTIAMCFSNGLDSTFSSLRNRDKRQFLMTFFHSTISPALEQYKRATINHFAQQYGHANYFAKSNYETFLNKNVVNKLSRSITNWRLDAIEGLGWVGLAAPILFLKGYTKLHIAGSLTWDCPYLHLGNPIIDDNLSFAQVTVKHDGFDATRLDKTEYLVTYCREQNIEKLFICPCQNKSIGNCCVCDKCLQTICGFLTLQEDHRKFGFDISKDRVIIALKKRYPRNKVSRFFTWHLACMQDRLLNNMINSSNTKDAFYAWFLNFDLNTINKDARGPFTLIKWAEFQDLYPHIPSRVLSKCS